MPRRILLITSLILLAAILLAAPALLRGGAVSGEAVTLASPLQAGCYIAAPDDCRIHVDPFTIKTTGARRLVALSLSAIEAESGTERLLYDYRTDPNSPPPRKRQQLRALAGHPGLRRRMRQDLPGEIAVLRRG